MFKPAVYCQQSYVDFDMDLLTPTPAVERQNNNSAKCRNGEEENKKRIKTEKQRDREMERKVARELLEFFWLREITERNKGGLLSRVSWRQKKNIQEKHSLDKYAIFDLTLWINELKSAPAAPPFFFFFQEYREFRRAATERAVSLWVRDRKRAATRAAMRRWRAVAHKVHRPWRVVWLCNGIFKKWQQDHPVNVCYRQEIRLASAASIGIVLTCKYWHCLSLQVLLPLSKPACIVIVWTCWLCLNVQVLTLSKPASIGIL